MLSPKCDSTSFYLNSRSGLATWAAWSWRAYLSLDNKDHDEYSKKNDGKYTCFETYEDFLKYGSNQGAVERSALKRKKNLWRLIEPIADIPGGLSMNNAPNIIISTASGDPLHDEGIAFGNALKKMGAKVVTLESRSSHTMGWEFDSGFKKQLIAVLREAMFEK